jgi:hypothetical protein
MNTYDRYVFSAIFATLLRKNADFQENRLFTALISIFESTLPILNDASDKTMPQIILA